MPQLDKFAFSPQVFWLVLVFFVLYLFLARNGLSVLYRIFIFRKKSIQIIASRSGTFVGEVVAFNVVVGKAILSSTLIHYVDMCLKSVKLLFKKRLLQYTATKSVLLSLVNGGSNSRIIFVRFGLLPVVKTLTKRTLLYI